ncbi:MAG: dephospho-CoA kinase [Frankiaceae bacterium]|nr:dephospho-CoA kinase [Frankiaceae bacterium]
MLRVGLTGGMGSGKSEVASLLAKHGAVIIDLDLIAREVVEPGQPALEQIVERFGPGLLQADGTLDRPAMAQAVFGDPAARAELEKIIFAQMSKSSQAKAARAREEQGEDAIMVTDAPILFETHMERNLIGVIVVEAPIELRIARLKEGRGVAEEDARARMAAQVSDETRRAGARWLVVNDGGLDELAAKVGAVWGELVELNKAVVALGLSPTAPIPLDQPLPTAP